MADVWLGCTEFPRVNTGPPRRGGSVELLEVDTDGPVASGSTLIIPGAQNVSSEDRRPPAVANGTLPFRAK